MDPSSGGLGRRDPRTRRRRRAATAVRSTRCAAARSRRAWSRSAAPSNRIVVAAPGTNSKSVDGGNCRRMTWPASVDVVVAAWPSITRSSVAGRGARPGNSMRVTSRSSSIADVSVTMSRRPPDGIDATALMAGSMICARAHAGSRCVVAPVAPWSRSMIPASRTGESAANRSIVFMVAPIVRTDPHHRRLRCTSVGPRQWNCNANGWCRPESAGPECRARAFTRATSARHLMFRRCPDAPPNVASSWKRHRVRRSAM